MSPLGILLLTYGLVFVAEGVGDKLLFTTGVLATRYRAGYLLGGICVAFMMENQVRNESGRRIRQSISESIPGWLVRS